MKTTLPWYSSLQLLPSYIWSLILANLSQVFKTAFVDYEINLEEDSFSFVSEMHFYFFSLNNLDNWSNIQQSCYWKSIFQKIRDLSRLRPLKNLCFWLFNICWGRCRGGRDIAESRRYWEWESNTICHHNTETPDCLQHKTSRSWHRQKCFIGCYSFLGISQSNPRSGKIWQSEPIYT